MGFFQEWLSIVITLFRKSDKAIEPLPPDTSFVGKSIIVTGATSGLGLEAAIIYVQLGAETVYITSRNVARGAEAKATIEERTGKKDVVKVLVLDMDTFDGVQQFVEVLKKEVKSIGMQFLPVHPCVEKLTASQTSSSLTRGYTTSPTRPCLRAGKETCKSMSSQPHY